MKTLVNTLPTPRIQSVTHPFLLIQQAGSLFGLDLTGVQEVSLTPLPNTARQVMGYLTCGARFWPQRTSDLSLAWIQQQFRLKAGLSF
jgi:hypothetical protein